MSGSRQIKSWIQTSILSIMMKVISITNKTVVWIQLLWNPEILAEEFEQVILKTLYQHYMLDLLGITQPCRVDEKYHEKSEPSPRQLMFAQQLITVKPATKHHKVAVIFITTSLFKKKKKENKFSFKPFHNSQRQLPMLVNKTLFTLKNKGMRNHTRPTKKNLDDSHWKSMLYRKPTNLFLFGNLLPFRQFLLFDWHTILRDLLPMHSNTTLKQFTRYQLSDWLITPGRYCGKDNSSGSKWLTEGTGKELQLTTTYWHLWQLIFCFLKNSASLWSAYLSFMFHCKIKGYSSNTSLVIGGSSELPMWLTDGFWVTFFGRWRGAVHIHVSHVWQLTCTVAPMWQLTCTVITIWWRGPLTCGSRVAINVHGNY